MPKQTSRTGNENAATSTASTPKKQSLKDQSLALRESLRNGTHNPFQRVDGRLLERINHDLTKPPISSYEDSPF